MLAVASGCPTFELSANQHTPFADRFVRPLFGGQGVTSGFTGTFADDQAGCSAPPALLFPVPRRNAQEGGPADPIRQGERSRLIPCRA